MTHPPATGRDLRAARDTLPVALSVAPFGLVIGATATQLGVPPLADMAAAATVFAGAAHFAPLTMVAAGAGVLTALLVAVAGAPLPGGVGVIAGIGAGIAAGALLDRMPS
ncbi:AzlC family ABC transporter permease [Pseudonocardia sp. DSM 110487]|uniref:AzlC family ABC transporter permease n=1 Tax=Pseudonocardia sp. DSM 110487 TaxID=2865833 RepID=UPI001C69CB8D|nr:AzlC family ABC transporter permease [Pseudonocardia sp. DSM 110487]QYN35992.1 AzlC family ABC transporter permease [Pseudonocardia sp. DSM 110487]